MFYVLELIKLNFFIFLKKLRPLLVWVLLKHLSLGARDNPGLGRHVYMSCVGSNQIIPQHRFSGDTSGKESAAVQET